MLAILVAVRTAGVEVAVGDGMGVGERVGVIEAVAGMLVVVATEGTAVLAVLQPHASIMAMVKKGGQLFHLIFSLFLFKPRQKGKVVDNDEWEKYTGD